MARSSEWLARALVRIAPWLLFVALLFALAPDGDVHVDAVGLLATAP